MEVSGSKDSTSIGDDKHPLAGTNTDSVIIDVTRATDPSTRGVLASYKAETTLDVTSGIETGIKKVLEAAGVDGAGPQLLSLTVGTTVRNRESNRTSYRY